MTRYYSEDHEWVEVKDGVATVGITVHAAEQLGEIVFVEVKDIGHPLQQAGELGVVESVKAASDIYAPISGEVLSINQKIIDNPGLLNEDAEGGAWLCTVKISKPEELAKLMDKAQYDKLIA